MDYRGARFYDSDVGRFLSLDPLAADFVAWSPYNYVLGNPVRLVDPDGKAPTNGDPPKQVSWGSRILGLAADLSPVGPVKGVIEAFTGSDVITGEPLSGVERAMGVVPGGKVLKAGGFLFSAVVRHGDEVADGVNSISKNLNVVTSPQKSEKWAKAQDKLDEAAKGKSGTEPIVVTKEGVAIPKGDKYKVEDDLIENPFNPPNTTAYGKIENGKFKEKLRIDPGTPPGKRGPNESHYHRNNTSKHYGPNQKDGDPGFKMKD